MKRKFTVFLMPTGEGTYQAFVPHYPNAVTEGRTVDEALACAREALEAVLETEAKHGGDSVPDYVHASHIVVGEIEAVVPEELIESEEHPQDQARESDPSAISQAEAGP